MPSTMVISVFMVLDSSTVMTPSLPTFSMASAIRLPIVSSPEEMAATCAMACLVSMGLLISLSVFTASSVAISMPFFTTIGFAPAATFFRPSRIIACASSGGGGGAVADDVVGLGGDFLDQLRAHVLKGVFQLDFLGDGHAVVGDQRRAELLVQHHVAALRAQSDLNGVRQRVHASFQRAASVLAIFDLLSHDISLLLFDDREDVGLTDDDVGPRRPA